MNIMLLISSALTVQSLKKYTRKLKGIVEECAEKISGDLCFPEDFRSNFWKENFLISNEESDNPWQSIKPVVEEFKGDAEKF